VVASLVGGLNITLRPPYQLFTKPPQNSQQTLFTTPVK
jgi:hypothetical protein